MIPGNIEVTNMFSNDSGASCGPTNALQTLGKHVSAESSPQRERVVPADHLARQNFKSNNGMQERNRQLLDRSFQEFSDAGNSRSHHQFTPHLFQSPSTNQIPLDQRHHAINQARTRQDNDWASEFSMLSLDHSRSSPQLSHQLQSSSGWQSEFLTRVLPSASPSPLYDQEFRTPYVTSGLSSYSAYSVEPTVGRQVEHKQMHSLYSSREEENRLFEDAFDQMQKSLDNHSDTINRQADTLSEEKEKQGETDEHMQDEDLSELASVIVKTINDTSAFRQSETAQKLKSSNFISLMERLSQKEVVLQGDKFVDSKGVDIRNSPAETSNARNISNNDFDPVQEEEKELKSALDGITLPILSPYDMAKLIGPNGFANASQWEEKYHEDDDIWVQ